MGSLMSNGVPLKHCCDAPIGAGGDSTCQSHQDRPLTRVWGRFGNGMMPAFRAESRVKVDELHAAGLASGGVSPGTRAAYTRGFYVAYLRDPIGNKLAVSAIVNSRRVRHAAPQRARV
jgi:hypothetical protein